MIVTRSSQLLGIGLLVFVNIIWVAASEITRYLFIDLDFKRPFFFTYAKSCMLSLFLLRYACVCTTSNGNSKTPPTPTKTASKKKKAGSVLYSQLNDMEENSSGGEEEEEDDFHNATLTEAEFEPLTTTDVESNTSAPDQQQQLATAISTSDPNAAQAQAVQQKRRPKKVRFAMLREIRRWPEKLEQAAKAARTPYRPQKQELCSGDCFTFIPGRNSVVFNYSVYFAPLWLISSVSYQTALAYSSVSAVNLISASSPLFVLILGAFFGRYSSREDTFTNFHFKLILVLLNLAGVCIVSRFSDSLLGSLVSLFSAFSNAVYLFALSRLSITEENVDMPLMLGIVGIFSLLVCTPLMFFLHSTGVEPQLPPPTAHQMAVLVANAFLGTLFADSLWLYATLLTGSLTSALSGSLGIPLSMLADSFFRNQPPNIWQIISSIPIMISFVGASFLTTATTNGRGASHTLVDAQYS